MSANKLGERMARYGWALPVFQMSLALLNLAVIVFADGGWASWFAFAWCGGFAILGVFQWRGWVRDHAEDVAWWDRWNADIQRWAP